MTLVDIRFIQACNRRMVIIQKLEVKTLFIFLRTFQEPLFAYTFSWENVREKFGPCIFKIILNMRYHYMERPELEFNWYFSLNDKT